MFLCWLGRFVLRQLCLIWELINLRNFWGWTYGSNLKCWNLTINFSHFVFNSTSWSSRMAGRTGRCPSSIIPIKIQYLGPKVFWTSDVWTSAVVMFLNDERLWVVTEWDVKPTPRWCCNKLVDGSWYWLLRNQTISCVQGYRIQKNSSDKFTFSCSAVAGDLQRPFLQVSGWFKLQIVFGLHLVKTSREVANWRMISFYEKTHTQHYCWWAKSCTRGYDKLGVSTIHQ